MKRYLLFASHSYSYDIMRPIESAIKRRGDEVAWYLEDTCPDRLKDGEERLRTIEEVMQYNPIACIVPGNVVYDFFPGVKVEVFHGYPVRKRGEKVDENFRMRGWFDIYCSPGPSSTEVLMRLEKKHKYFKYYETGWSRVDVFMNIPEEKRLIRHNPPRILYAPTFTKSVTSVNEMYKLIDEQCQVRDWRWLLSFHPLITDETIIGKYKELVERYPDKVAFDTYNGGVEKFTETDVMLADSSAVICEYLIYGKPVVTYKNTCPGAHIIDCSDLKEIPEALERAMDRPVELMSAASEYAHTHESYYDGKNSDRVLDAIDDYIENYKGRLKKKPLNLIRRIKLRYRLGYWKNFFGGR